MCMHLSNIMLSTAGFLWTQELPQLGPAAASLAQRLHKQETHFMKQWQGNA